MNIIGDKVRPQLLVPGKQSIDDDVKATVEAIAAVVVLGASVATG